MTPLILCDIILIYKTLGDQLLVQSLMQEANFKQKVVEKGRINSYKKLVV